MSILTPGGYQAILLRNVQAEELAIVRVNSLERLAVLIPKDEASILAGCDDMITNHPGPFDRYLMTEEFDQVTVRESI